MISISTARIQQPTIKPKDLSSPSLSPQNMDSSLTSVRSPNSSHANLPFVINYNSATCNRK